MDREKITAWITRNALTSGIEKVEGEVCHDIASNMFHCAGKCHSVNVHGNDWHRTKEAAIKRAEEMRLKKISSLKKQLEKLEKIRFE